MTTNEKALKLHADLNGKLSTEAKCHVKSREDLSVAYTREFDTSFPSFSSVSPIGAIFFCQF